MLKEKGYRTSCRLFLLLLEAKEKKKEGEKDKKNRGFE